MNKQLKIKAGVVKSRGIEWVGTVLHQPIEGVTYPWTRPDGEVVHLVRNGYTSNPIAGCHYGCRWVMPADPDGSDPQLGEDAQRAPVEAICYAEAFAERVGMYDGGFAPVSGGKRTYHENYKDFSKWARLKQPSEIFVGSQADMFGPWVLGGSIAMLLAAMNRAKQHRYYMLTKNPKRLAEFREYFEPNMWVGASVPPSGMNGQRFDLKQQQRILWGTLDALQESRYGCGLRWLSAEPLSWDVGLQLLAWAEGHPDNENELRDAVDWIVVGAASNRGRTYQPKLEWVEFLLEVADYYDVPVFFKGNLKGLQETWPVEGLMRWREEKPLFGNVVNFDNAGGE